MILKKPLAALVASALGAAFMSPNAMAAASFNTLIDTPTELKVQWSGNIADFNSVTPTDPTYWDILGFDFTTTTKNLFGLGTITTWDAAVAAQHDSVTPAHPHPGDNALGPVFLATAGGQLGFGGLVAKQSPHNSTAWVAWDGTSQTPHWDHYSFTVITNTTTGVDTATLYAIHPVPEPESYAMFLAGLGLMGAIARRRRNRN